MKNKNINLILISIAILMNIFMIGFLILTSPYFSGSSEIVISSSTEDLKETISLNNSDKDDLMRLPQIGYKIADRIIAYRETIGSFKSIDELLNVKGIGKKTYERILPFLTL